MKLECGWRHAQKRWSWEFEDFEKMSFELSDIEARGKVLQISTDRDLKQLKMRRVLGWGQHSMVSIGF